MANDYYGRDRSFTPFTRARGDDVQFELDAIQVAFDKLPSESRVLSANSNFVTAGGTANAITVSAPTTWASYTGKDGYRLSIKITTANTGVVTLNVDSLGAKACVRLDGDALAADDLQVNGIYDFFYNNTTGKFHVAAWNSFVTDAETAATNAATSETNAASSASSASSSASSASTSATTATNYATKTDGFASGSDNSAKSWAVGGTGDGQPPAGPAKDWATKAEDSAVDGVDYSAFHWSKKAEGWAASVNLPNIAGNALKILRAKSDESGHEYIEQPYTQTAADARFAQLAGGADADFTLMPRVGGDPVVESDSNAAGEFTRWADGTQHVTKRVAKDLLTDTASGNIFASASQSAETMAASFVKINFASITLDAESSNGNARWVISSNTTDLSLSAWQSYLVADTQSQTGQIDVHFFATGDWK